GVRPAPHPVSGGIGAHRPHHHPHDQQQRESAAKPMGKLDHRLQLRRSGDDLSVAERPVAAAARTRTGGPDVCAPGDDEEVVRQNPPGVDCEPLALHLTPAMELIPAGILPRIAEGYTVRRRGYRPPPSAWPNSRSRVMNLRSLLAAPLLALLVTLLLAAGGHAQAQDLRVMAFNIRYAHTTPPNLWDDRRAAVRQVKIGRAHV